MWFSGGGTRGEGSQGKGDSQLSANTEVNGPVCPFCGVSGHVMAKCVEFEQYKVALVKREGNSQ